MFGLSIIHNSGLRHRVEQVALRVALLHVQVSILEASHTDILVRPDWVTLEIEERVSSIIRKEAFILRHQELSEHEYTTRMLRALTSDLTTRIDGALLLGS